MTRQWFFQEFRPGDTQKDPISGAFFQQDAIQDTAAALVRESVQNSLDATLEGQRTRVRFRILKSLPPDTAQSASLWVDGLGAHVSAPDNGLGRQPRIGAVAPVLVVEDFGTKGLVGDPNAHQSSSGAANDFFAFFRAEGFHQKSEASLGKWGIGKTVFPRSSRLNVYFGLSIRADDPNPLLMGRAILKTHTVEGQKWHPDGYLGVPRGDGLVLPFTHPTDVTAFSRTFSLQRTHEPGLSVVVPFADPDIDEDRLLKAAIRDYFVPVLEGRLRIEIAGGTPREQWVVEKSSLRSIMDKRKDLFDDLDRARVAAAAAALALGADHWERMPPSDRVGVPTLEKGSIPSPQLERLRASLRRGQPFAVDQPFTIQPKSGGARLGSVKVFFQPAEVGKRTPPTFVRNGIVISGAGGRTTNGILGFALLSGPAGEFVGASENVAHTEWNPSRSGFKDRYKYASGTLSFIKNYPADLLNMLSLSEADEDPDLLSQVFYLDIEPDPDLDEGEGTGDTQTTKGRRPVRVTGPGGSGPATQPRYELRQREGGFVVTNGNRPDGFEGDIRFKVAYDMRNKNPLLAYAATDFDFRDGLLSLQLDGGISVLQAEKNELVLRVSNGAFVCEVTGFDTERDLFVKARVIREGAADDDS